MSRGVVLAVCLLVPGVAQGQSEASRAVWRRAARAGFERTEPWTVPELTGWLSTLELLGRWEPLDFGDDACAKVCGHLEADDPGVRTWAARALGGWADAAPVGSLVEVCPGSGDEVSLEIGRALLRLGPVAGAAAAEALEGDLDVYATQAFRCAAVAHEQVEPDAVVAALRGDASLNLNGWFGLRLRALAAGGSAERLRLLGALMEEDPERFFGLSSFLGEGAEQAELLRVWAGAEARDVSASACREATRRGVELSGEVLRRVWGDPVLRRYGVEHVTGLRVEAWYPEVVRALTEPGEVQGVAALGLLEVEGWEEGAWEVLRSSRPGWEDPEVEGYAAGATIQRVGQPVRVLGEELAGQAEVEGDVWMLAEDRVALRTGPWYFTRLVVLRFEEAVWVGAIDGSRRLEDFGAEGEERRGLLRQCVRLIAHANLGLNLEEPRASPVWVLPEGVEAEWVRDLTIAQTARTRTKHTQGGF